MKKAICIIATIILALMPIIPWIHSISKSIEFDSNCGDYLRMAADANNIDIAEKHLSTAISYLEDNGLTSGYTKIVFYYPRNDIGLWYENLKASQTQLQDLKTREYTDLEESNILMKLRETLLNSGGGLTHPDGISMSHYYSLIFWLNILLWLPCWALATFFGFIAVEEL